MSYLRSSSLAKNILLSNFFRLKEPYKIAFSVTYRCNSKCKTCNIWKRSPSSELSSDEFDRIFERLKPPWVNLTGGEIFLREDIMDIVSSIRKKFNPFIFNITTNGLMTEKIVEKVKEMEKLNFQKFFIVVSIDGPEEIHDNIRGMKGAWKKSLQTYKELKKLSLTKRFKVFIGYTISNLNLGFFEDAYRHVKTSVPGVSMKDFHFNLFHVSPHYFFNEENGFLKERDEILDEIKIAKDKKPYGLSPVTLMENRYLKILGDYVRDGKASLRCASLSSSCFIDPSGNVYPCMHFNRKLGNLRDSDYDLSRIWNSKKSKIARKEIVKHKCPGCWTPCEAYQTILGNLFRLETWKFL